MSDRPIKAWHFTRPGGVLGYGDPRIVVPGETLSHEGPVELCLSGLHASRRIIDALDHLHWSGGMLWRVEVWGDVQDGDDKIVGRHRRALWGVPCDPVLRDFARRCALDVVHLWDAPDVVVRYLRTGDESIRDAARDAAWAAARDAAWAARNAARAAARDAAWAAARARHNSRLTHMMIAEAKRRGVYR